MASFEVGDWAVEEGVFLWDEIAVYEEREAVLHLCDHGFGGGFEETGLLDVCYLDGRGYVYLECA